ncbi:hypothetical protein [Streptomyces sp. IBSBF 2806]|uniref:hypothetical protein n=1 Tax=Streptomyces sp. IBSBF 2806 TaxID=2903529 RepID=UPI002FDC4593
MTTGPYEIETSEADDGTTVPAAGIWSPGEAVKEYGFLAYSGLHITGIGGLADDDAYPAALVFLGKSAC